jgi:plastocyanin
MVTRSSSIVPGSTPGALTWDESIGVAPERCITIRAGQLLCWVGNFEEHPLQAHGGATPTPIDGGDCVTFGDEGDYGFICTLHPDMVGVVRVVP